MRVLALVIASVTPCLLAEPAAAEGKAALEERGRDIVVAKCARCHATGKEDASPHAAAPPFRTIVTRYPAANLAEALAEGIVSGHPDMPEFVFAPPAIEAILAYLESLETPKD